MLREQIRSGDHLVVALSGGLDSVVLLDLLAPALGSNAVRALRRSRQSWHQRQCGHVERILPCAMPIQRHSP